MVARLQKMMVYMPLDMRYHINLTEPEYLMDFKYEMKFNPSKSRPSGFFLLRENLYWLCMHF